ncbi:MAG: MMPL family transporter [Deltaproteobacteria bacterium]|nr:MMPL family transporter [Deltaproteobacteria bacterium]
MQKPKTVIAFYVLISVIFLLAFPHVRVDTDPENMLSENEPVRLAHEEAKHDFSLFDSIIVGVVDESAPDGVFSAETLQRHAAVTERILQIEGVIAEDVMSLTTTDDIDSEGGMLNIEPLMKKAGVLTDAEALQVRDAALENPVLKDLLVSEDGKAITIAVPIKEKKISYKISKEIEKIIEEEVVNVGGSEEYHIAGLPVAEDTFGVEMFKQMGISAPVAGFIIFLLMLYFFRNLRLVGAAMAVAMMTVAWSMGLLIWSGFTVHIMSSMIPIFLMPIAVVDSIHFLSEFHDRYDPEESKNTIINSVMGELLTPMFYTSVTSAVGFLSLMLTPIPPVKVFGAFVAFGIIIAWFLTITLLPAIIILLPKKSFSGFGRGVSLAINPLQERIGLFASRWSRAIIVVAFISLGISIYGITLTKVNDNPVKWFEKNHPVRVADKVLNKHFGGTYMSYLIVESTESGAIKDPLMVGYIEELQRKLNSIDVVGKTTSIADVIKKIGFELRNEDKAFFKIPDNKKTIAQYLFLYEFSGDPEDLYHLVTPDFKKANIWVQLKSGDNADMRQVEVAMEEYIEKNPPPLGASLHWAGLTYINVVWQDKMVYGMLSSLMGGAFVIFIIMTLLFRSFAWGFISMLPLTFTITFIYGLVGFVGKDYDMPIAVLSALTLGISVDFAIHFGQRMRQIRAKGGEWNESIKEVFGEPVRAIFKNMVVITVSFLPLLFSTLLPYRTVGVFFALIMAISGAATLLLLTAVMNLLRGPLKL